jgi:ABC-type nitrate/sulfonate/bicarbonate transport system substrate-binding protein
MPRPHHPAGPARLRRIAAAVMFLAAPLSGCAPSGSSSVPGSAITIGISDDPAKHLAFWALENGKVDTGGLDIKITYLPNQSALQAYQSRQFNVVEASPVGVALAAQKGLATSILSAGLTDLDATVIDAAQSSGVRDPGQLRGKKLAISSPTGSSTIQTQFVLSKKYGLDTKLQGGDLAFQTTAPEALVSLLSGGGVDATTNLNKPRYLLEHTPGFAPILHVSKSVHEILGAYPVTTVLTTYPEIERDRKDELTTLATALKASTDYAREHKPEVIAAVAGGNQADVDYLNWWATTSELRYGNLSTPDEAGINAFWTMANAVGQLNKIPSLAELKSVAAPALAGK